MDLDISLKQWLVHQSWPHSELSIEDWIAVYSQIACHVNFLVVELNVVVWAEIKVFWSDINRVEFP